MEVKNEAEIVIGELHEDLMLFRSVNVKAEDGQKIIVHGRIYAEEDVTFDCSVEAERLDTPRKAKIHRLMKETSLEVEINGDLTINKYVKIRDGCLTVYGNASARIIDVGGKTVVKGTVKAQEINIGGKAIIGGDVETEDLDVSGSLKVKGKVQAENIDTGGSFKVSKTVHCKSLNAGGSGAILAGEIQEINAGGSFTIEELLKFETIDVGGSVKCGGNLHGDEINAGGSIRVKGDFAVKEYFAGGKLHLNSIKAKGEA